MFRIIIKSSLNTVSIAISHHPWFIHSLHGFEFLLFRQCLLLKEVLTLSNTSIAHNVILPLVAAVATDASETKTQASRYGCDNNDDGLVWLCPGLDLLDHSFLVHVLSLLVLIVVLVTIVWVVAPSAITLVIFSLFWKELCRVRIVMRFSNDVVFIDRSDTHLKIILVLL